jgi:hypothetical protein
MDTAVTQSLTHLALGALAPSPTAVQAKRRRRYDKAAGLLTIPTVVRSLTDTEVPTVQLVG